MPAIHRRSFVRPQGRHLEVSPRQAGNSTTISSSALSFNSLSTPATASQPVAPGPDNSASSASGSTSSDLGTTSGDSTSTRTSITSTRTSTTETTTSQPSSTTSSTLSSTSRPTPSLTAAPSSSQSASRSTSTSVSSESSTVLPVSSDAGTTLVAPPPSSTTVVVQTSTTPPPVPTESVASSSSNGFFQNTAAVAGTFTALGVVLLGLVLCFFLRRKLRRAVERDRGDSESFTSFAAEPEMVRKASARTVSANGHSTTSPGPSIIELTTQTPMDPHAMNHSHIPLNHGYNYASSALRGLPPVQEQEFPFGSAYEQTISEPSHYSTSTHPSQLYYIPPPGHGDVPPVLNRKSVARGSYQPSIDSFYGAA